MTAEAAADPIAPATAGRLTSAEHLGLMLYGGGLLVLINFSGPMFGLVTIPVTFFLKNRLHLHSNELALFNLWVGTPLFVSFLFGFLRDRWSPFRTGDRGHVVIFGLVTAAIFAGLALFNPTYASLLIGLLAATVTFLMVWSAAAGLISTIGQQEAMAGRMSTAVSIAACLPAIGSYLAGGALSGLLEGQNAMTAARILFMVAAAMMVVIALFGALGPRSLFDASSATAPTASVFRDIARLVRHWPIYPVLMIQLLWQFSPGTGTVLQYHLTNTLHASDAQWGAWNAIFLGSFVPIYLVYSYLCQRVRLSWLLWGGFFLAVFQMAPLLFVHTAVGALWAAAMMGVIGAIAQAALTDLAIRSCPDGLQGTMMMLFTGIYYIAVRFGDLFGTDLYDHHGGFLTAVVATIIVYALILPILLLVPRRLIATTDGQALAVDG
jgi:MFS family permease